MLQTLKATAGKKFARWQDERLFARAWPQIEQVEGLLVPGQEMWLFRAARALPDGARIVEIGSYKGRSSVALGYGCMGSRKQLFSIDRFQGVYQDVSDLETLRDTFEQGFFEEWRANIKHNGLEQYVTPLIGDSQTIARAWAAPIHLLFIDGSHEYEDVIRDFDNFYPHVVEGGLIALHDVTHSWMGVYRAWHERIAGQLANTGRLASLSYGRKRESRQTQPIQEALP